MQNVFVSFKVEVVRCGQLNLNINFPLLRVTLLLLKTTTTTTKTGMNKMNKKMKKKINEKKINNTFKKRKE